MKQVRTDYQKAVVQELARDFPKIIRYAWRNELVAGWVRLRFLWINQQNFGVFLNTCLEMGLVVTRRDIRRMKGYKFWGERMRRKPPDFMCTTVSIPQGSEL